MSEVGPRVYSQWIALFERFGSGDDTTLLEMQRGTLEPAGRARARWVSALMGALQRRLAGLSAQVGERLDRAIAVGDVSAVLGWTRAVLVPLYCFSRVPAFPGTVRVRIERNCRRWLEHAQDHLEREAARTDDRELLLLTVRRSPLRGRRSLAGADRSDPARTGGLIEELGPREC